MDIHKASATKLLYNGLCKPLILIGLDKFEIEVQCMEDVKTRYDQQLPYLPASLYFFILTSTL